MTVRAKLQEPREPRGPRGEDRRRRDRGREETRADVTAVPRAVRFVFGLIGLVGSLHVTAMIGVEIGRYSENAQEISRLRGDIAEIDRELSGLRAVLEHAGDARYREQLARRQGFAYPGERRFFTLAPEGPSGLQETGAGRSP